MSPLASVTCFAKRLLPSGTTGKSDEDKQRELEAKINHLRALEDRDFELWQFFENRADEIKGRLWTTATWLVMLKGALLAFILSERLMSFEDGSTLNPKAPLVVSALSGLGLTFAVLSWTVLNDIVGHVKVNWQRASAAKSDPGAALRSGRIYILFPLIVVEGFFGLAFVYLLAISYSSTAADWVIIGIVMTTAIGTANYRFCLQDRSEPKASKEQPLHESTKPASKNQSSGAPKE